MPKTNYFAKNAVCAIAVSLAVFCACNALGAQESAQVYPLPLSDYPQTDGGLWRTLTQRVGQVPFNLLATAIFFAAIVHTFCHRYFLRLAETVKKRRKNPIKAHIESRVLHLLGEVEIIFALWLIPLFAAFWYCYGWGALTAYLDALTFDEHKYIEPIFVVFVMCVSATKPIIQLSEDIINFFANIFEKICRNAVMSWWIAIFCIGSLLGSFITEPAAITICAVLLNGRFFKLQPTEKFKYATLGLLLTAVSAGGVLTHFSAPPVLMVASAWDWDTHFMLTNFGLKAVGAIFASTLLILFMFRREFALLKLRAAHKPRAVKTIVRAPLWIVAVHVAFLAAIVITLHHPALMIFIFLAFAAFVETTQEYQFKITFKSQLLVGLFLAALVTHGSLQGWWIEPVLTSLDNRELFAGAIALTAFNDNAAITYLATLVPNFSDAMKYTVVAGAIAGGGLTVIANAPNPAGIAILSKHFAGGVSPMRLFGWALIPTVIVCAFFVLA